MITFICAKAVISGEITFGVLVATQFIIGMLNAPVLQFIQFIVALETANISFQRINEIHEIQDENQNQHPTPAILPISKTIVVNNLSFQYHRNEPFILKNINLIIPEGKITAIVGESGCDKSILIKNINLYAF